MLKKIFNIILIAIISICLIGCNEEIEPIQLDTYMDQVISEFPDIISDNYLLPLLDENDVSVTYSSDDVSILNNVVLFERGHEDYYANIFITITRGEEQLIDQKSVLISDVVTKEEQRKISDFIEGYEAELPPFITGNFMLPYYVSTEINATINVTTNMECKDDEYIYNYPEEDEVFTISLAIECGDSLVRKDIDLVVLSDENRSMVPKMCIDTNGIPVTSLEDYIGATMSYYEKDENYEYQPVFENVALGIRGRGNSTWGFDKKPYKLKFDSKISFFGGTKNKKWVLLANYVDHSLIRNYLAYYLGKKMDNLAFTVDFKFVELYMNGKYAGNYMLTDQVEVKKGRVDIDDDITKVECGFMIELDNKFFESNTGTEGKEYFVINVLNRDNIFALKTPDPEESEILESQNAYIKQYMKDVFHALKHDENIEDYIDIPSAVDCFIVEEFFKNKDAGHSSFYLYKDVDSKLFFGPLWDFDLSAMGQGELDSYNRSAEGWYTSQDWINPFFYYLMRSEVFTNALKQRWRDVKYKAIPDMIDEIPRIVDYIHYSSKHNFELWDNLIGIEQGWWISTDVHKAKTYEAQIELLTKYFNDRFKWMDENIPLL